MLKYTLKTILSCSVQKNGSQKQLIFEKYDFSHPGQKWPQCKGYSLWKIVSLGQKLNSQKHAKKHSRNVFKLFCAKRTPLKKS